MSTKHLISIKPIGTVLNDYFSKPKGNGINRQLKRTKREIAIKKIKVIEDAVMGAVIGNVAATASGVKDICALCGISATSGTILAALGYQSLNSSIESLNELKASETYKAVVKRAKNIYDKKGM